MKHVFHQQQLMVVRSGGFQRFPSHSGQYELSKLKEITGVRGSTSTDILLAELGLKSQQHVWLLCAARFWNNLAGKPHGTI